jgi:hypothetical protein
METEPFSGVAMPLDVEAVAAYPVEAGEGCIELFAEVIREAGAIAPEIDIWRRAICRGYRRDS